VHPMPLTRGFSGISDRRGSRGLVPPMQLPRELSRINSEAFSSQANSCVIHSENNNNEMGPQSTAAKQAINCDASDSSDDEEREKNIIIVKEKGSKENNTNVPGLESNMTQDAPMNECEGLEKLILGTSTEIKEKEVVVDIKQSIQEEQETRHNSIYREDDLGSSECRLEQRRVETDGERVVLVVDDAPMNRKMLCRLLVGYCTRTIAVEDGLKGVEEMKQNIESKTPICLVLMDYQMPVMDGPSAANEMRGLGYTGPIIGVTGNALSSHVKTFTENGADRVLSKPLNFDALIQALIEIGYPRVLRLDSKSTQV